MLRARSVDEEDPVPADVIGQEAAQRRPDQRADSEDSSEEALVLAPLGRREEIADHGQRDREDGAGAEPLEAARGDQLPHLLGQAGEGRADQEDADADHDHRAAPEQVGELAVDRTADGRGQQVDGHHPGVEVVPVQVGDDARQRGADDGLIEGRQEHGEQDRNEDLGPGPGIHAHGWVHRLSVGGHALSP